MQNALRVIANVRGNLPAETVRGVSSQGITAGIVNSAMEMVETEAAGMEVVQLCCVKARSEDTPINWHGIVFGIV